jgi:predicted GIY-YIG superfamily endonuclease
MSLELPSDLTQYTDGHEEIHSAGAYSLILQRPVDLRERWQHHYDTKPPYWNDLVQADSVFYVGATGDLLSRLEDHRNGGVRQTVLTRVCEVVGLQVAWVSESSERAFEVDEPRLARWLAKYRPDAYVHTR